eukprot:178865-Amphidinium_carterae.1
MRPIAKGTTSSRRPSFADSTPQSVTHFTGVTITNFYSNAPQIPSVIEKFNDTGTTPDQQQPPTEVRAMMNYILFGY